MDIIREIKRPLSTLDLQKMLGNKIKIIDYRKLHKYHNIDNILGKYGCVILLYETRLNYGHWVCLFKDGNIIEHFDSYGYRPDEELKFTPKYFRETYYGKLPHLVTLLMNSPYKIRYNHYKLQKHGNGISTCGRWVALRLLLRNLDEHQFKKLFTVKGIPKDYLVTLITQNLLN